MEPVRSVMSFAAAVLKGKAAATPASSSTVGASDFVTREILGQGGYGIVVKVIKKTGADSEKVYAMKRLKGHNSWKKGEPERRALEAVKNVPFLTQIHYCYEMHSSMCLVLDYLEGGDLISWMRCSVSVGKFVVAELILAVEHLHRLRIIHRDIKLDNVMLDKDGHVVLGDFGTSKQFPSENQENVMRETYNVMAYGTLAYCAPELLKGQPHGFPVDWWSVGVLLHGLLTAKFPFHNESTQQLCSMIKECEPEIDAELPAVAVSLIKGVLEKDEKMRLGSNRGANELKSHEFFKGKNWESLAHKRYRSPIKKIWKEKKTANLESAFNE